MSQGLVRSTGQAWAVPRKALHSSALCSSGEDWLAKGCLALAGLHDRRRAPHRTRRKTRGPGAAARWPVPPERGQRVHRVQPNGEGVRAGTQRCPVTRPVAQGFTGAEILVWPLLTDFPSHLGDWVSLSHLLQLGFPDSLTWNVAEGFLSLAHPSAVVRLNGSVPLREGVIWETG